MIKVGDLVESKDKQIYEVKRIEGGVGWIKHTTTNKEIMVTLDDSFTRLDFLDVIDDLFKNMELK